MYAIRSYYDKLTYFYDDRWTSSNTTASKPRPNANGEDKYWISSDAVMDGSYFKVKQIQFRITSYNVCYTKLLRTAIDV